MNALDAGFWHRSPHTKYTQRNVPSQWRHNEHDCVSNHQPYDCLLNRLFRRRTKKASKLRVTGLCEGNSTVTGEFLAQRASNAENVSTWWRHHAHTVRAFSCFPVVWFRSTSLMSFSIISRVRAHKNIIYHYGDVIVGAIVSQITSLTIVYSTVYSGADQRNHQSSASLAFVQGIHRGPVNSPHKWPVTRKMFPFDDVTMIMSDNHELSVVVLPTNANKAELWCFISC